MSLLSQIYNVTPHTGSGKLTPVQQSGKKKRKKKEAKKEKIYFEWKFMVFDASLKEARAWEWSHLRCYTMSGFINTVQIKNRLDF